jgi:hypothetical protein
MKNIAILTTSYLPDLEGFKRLHESVLRFTEEATTHHVIVPRRDFESFRRIRSPRLQVWAEPDFLPQEFISTDRLAALRRRVPILPRTVNCSAINVKRPWPPVRSWILQQILKLAAARELECSAVVIIDSDVILVRPMRSAIFFRGDAVRIYEKPEGITSELTRHFRWTRTAYELLGIPWQEQIAFPDYVGGIISWEPRLVSNCLQRIEEVHRRSWGTALSAQLHFSEFVLYGTYVRHFGSSNQLSFAEPTTLCHSYWSPKPMSWDAANSFVESYASQDVAIHIQSNSGTPTSIVEHVMSALHRGAAS